MICHTCPVRTECLEYALARPTLLGIWAATTSVERCAIRLRGEILPTVAMPERVDEARTRTS